MEKILLEYIIDKKHDYLIRRWNKITLTDKNVYLHYWLSKGGSERGDFEYIFKNNRAENHKWMRQYLLDIYNENLETINKYEELKNKILEYLKL